MQGSVLPVHAAAGVTALAPDTTGNIRVTLSLADTLAVPNENAVALKATSTAGVVPGYFSSGGTIFTSSADATTYTVTPACAPAYGNDNVTYSDACVRLIHANLALPARTTLLIFHCTGPGPVVFTMNQGTVFIQTAVINCILGNVSASTGSESVFMTAYPNVVSCTGGSSTITAYTHFQPPNVPTPPAGTNGLPLPQQPYFFFRTDSGLIQQTSNNTAILTVLQGMTDKKTTVTASTGSTNRSGEITVQVYCAPGSTGAATTTTTSTGTTATTGTTGTTTTTQPTLGGPTGVAIPPPGGTAAAAPTPAPPSTLNLVASPSALETCDGSLFLTATVKDAAGKLVPDGTAVLFLATRGILDPASATTTGGTANVVYTADLAAPAAIRLSAQAGTASGTVMVSVTCGSSGASTGSASGSGTSGSLPPPIGSTGANGQPTFRPPNTGETGQLTAVRLRPPNTGDAGLRSLEGGAE